MIDSKKILTLSSLLVLASSSITFTRAAYEPFKVDAIKVTNTLAADVNAAGVNQFNNINTTAVVNTSTDVFTSVTTNGVFCTPGTYMVDVVLYRTQTPFDNNTRSNVGVEVTVDSVGTGIQAADGYLRAHSTSGGHDEATTSATDLVTLSSVGKIGFRVERLADNRVNPAPAGQSILRIVRVDD